MSKTQRRTYPTLRSLLLLAVLSSPLGAFAQTQGSLFAIGDSDAKKPSAAVKADVPGNKAEAPTPTPTPAQAGEAEGGDSGKHVRYSFEVGGQWRDVGGDRPWKFEETKRAREGILFRRFSVTSTPEGSPAFLRLLGRSVSELDQHYLLDGGRYGRFRTTFEFMGLPHQFSRRNPTLLAETGDGQFAVPDQIQQTLQALDPPMAGTTAPANPALIASVRTFLANSPKADLRVKNYRTDFTQTFQLTENWSFRFRFFDFRRAGRKPLGTGSYERVGTSVGDTFRVHAIELPERVDFRTDEVTFGTSYVRRGWGLNFDYRFSKFGNDIESVVFENPFRLTDQQTPDAAGNFNRNAFARAVFARAPSNQAHTVSLSGFVDLPHDSRYAGALSWSRWTQDEQFVPYTLNTALRNAPAGQDLTSTASLPKQSLEGEVETWTHDHLFTSRLTSTLNLNLHYRAYDYNNNTEEILFPGYAAFPDAFFRTSIAGSFGTRLIENEPSSFLRQRFTAELGWDVTKKLNWTGEYEWEGWDRTHRQVERSVEHKVGTFFSYKPTSRFQTRLNYRYSDRTPDEYVVGPLENQSLRMFDQAKRLRHDLDFQWQWLARPGLGLSGTVGYMSDDYDQNFFGLTKYVERYGSLDFTYSPRENTTLYANYAREHYNSDMQSIAKSAVPFDLRNRWNRSDRNIFDSFGAGLTTYLDKGRWYLDVQYGLGFGSDRMTTVNVTAPSPINVLNAQAFPFPDAKSRYHEFNLDTNYQVSDRVALGLRYVYEPYRLDDWQWNSLSPYPVDQLAPETDGRRYLLLDSRYTSHNAHVVGVYLRFGK
jgi:MtrB/PioB family decaheme-associated outer membrane protein